MNWNNYWRELQRRNVIKSAVAYLVVAWVLLQVFSLLLPILNAPEWILKTITLILAIGLPIWIIISWIYDITPKGIEKTASESGTQLANQATNKRLNAFIIVSLSIAVIILTLNLSFFSTDSNKEYSIAIMPFKNIQVDENYSWLSPNFTQSVNSYLSKVKKLKVTDSYSSSKYNDDDKTNIEIGNALDVTYIVRASITQLQNKLSITVQLINTNSNKVEWSQQYNEIIEEDPLKLQQEVAQKIVAHLKVVLSPEDKNALKTLLTDNQEASIYFTEGKRIADKRTPKTMDSIITLSAQMFQKAIDLDPNFADAYAELAFVMRLMHEDHAIFKNSEKLEKINSLLQRSLEINPNTPRAYTTLGMMQMSIYEDLEKAKAFYEKALAIKPNDATTHHYYALYYRDKPDPDYSEELKHIKIAYRLNPFSAPINAIMVINLLRNEQITE
ncbi:MAG: hypothetical protein HKO90_09190, partial [Flavobacteriaceae bacterium]|nr:hypothetical protein [Flavobacteriaceae bacterium]